MIVLQLMIAYLQAQKGQEKSEVKRNTAGKHNEGTH